MPPVHRPAHKERSQLSHRARLGALEKHKDYVLRARDYHAKKDRLNRLRSKAADRNKDEFYFAMNKEKTIGGVHVQERGNTAMPIDMVKLLKTQDEGYIRTMKNLGLKVRAPPLPSPRSHVFTRVIENRQDQKPTDGVGQPGTLFRRG